VLFSFAVNKNFEKEKKKGFTSLTDQQGVGMELIHVVYESMMGGELFIGLACWMGAGMGLGFLHATLGGAVSHANRWW
jgi:hypothetical protein